jgi:hypothetical protein
MLMSEGALMKILSFRANGTQGISLKLILGLVPTVMLLNGL